MAEALQDPALELSAEGIAARAGVSLSTIFRHFGDLEGLSAAMRARLIARVAPVLAGPFEGDLRARVRELVRRRLAAFEIVGPLYRVSLRQPRRKAAVESEAEMDATMRAQLRTALAHELAGRGGPERAAMLDVVLSFDAWERLRRDEEIPSERVGAVMEKMVRSLLEEAPVRRERRP